MSDSQTALLIGSTGRIGKRVLKELLSSSSGFVKVGEYGRRVTPKANIEAATSANANVQLEQKEIDFENLSQSGMKDGNWDVVFITLGTTRATAGSAAQFEKIDKEYVLRAAKEAKSSDPNVKQRLVYISSTGANAKSALLYPRCKGETEAGLAELGYETIVLRPAFLRGEERGVVENVFSHLTTVLSKFSDSMEIPMDTVAKAMVQAGKLGAAKIPEGVHAQKGGSAESPYTIITNAGALAFAKLMT